MKRLVYAGLGAMVLFTGGYLVVYTARWEWQRALMAGELLLVSLLVVVAVAGADRLNRLERRIAELSKADAAPPEPFSLPYGTPGVETPAFRWMRPEPDSYRVFIPVLLGAGIAVSGLAALVERIASSFGGRGTARRLASLSVPSGGVLAGGPDPARPERSPGRWLRPLLWSVIVALVAAVAVAELADHTQDRPDEPVHAAASTVVIQADANGQVPADLMARRLWEYCRGSTRPYLDQGGLTSIGGGRYALVVQPALGEYALRRLKGCLSDAVVDHGSFRVISVHPDPG
ncbi:hypothetical protein SAMN04489712_109181 [Thermomonospora echinospora]|uniref:Uncharacterized protein n=1 Tax=Thermomonospora echinospora TaxID=1992 RepID=A0A1H6CCF5_9ACTN|nr:hypothetical protein [Thermomonospora echinospora]SEG70578.1 hypothetical protein SAMN04489712_109181 [Thermomonospora echinospora]